MEIEKFKFSKKSQPIVYILIAIVLTFASCKKDTYTYLFEDNSLPAAKFSYNINGFDVMFNNSSTDATSYTWDFGDGTSSNETNPTHTFDKKGKYTVILTVSDNNDKFSEYSEEVAIGFPVASFEYVADKQTVTFTNTSINSSSYEWDFGDNTTSTEKDPVHVFDEEGTYTVVLTAIDGADRSQFSQDIFVVAKFIPTILNNSFEEGKDYWTEDGTFYTTTGPPPPDGTHGAKLSNAGHVMAQTIEAGSHTDYTLKFWTVSKSTTAGCLMTITDGDGNELYNSDTGGTPDASNYIERSINFSTLSSTSVKLKVEYNGTECRFDYFTIQ